ncbi:WD repeat-containing protein on Y chromosome [Callorhinchus milii]|uniref:WD repeat-containing protein on Y chromosome n=1 Tax=Callorhinchus milii TaxID=7868 RepID=UPI0004573E89|nr:WD repeat-containing protein on Y chromosome [Callorhinchus milii]|eukprot:gi/632948297/ref/XP_007889514.1/ PREDICTED: WD repeat-containing protein on Y chromosome-like [Callorhinchus milii]
MSPRAGARTAISGTSCGSTSSGIHSQAKPDEWPEWEELLERDIFKLKCRRNTIGPTQNLAINVDTQRLGATGQIPPREKIEKQFSLEHLQRLQAAFEKSEKAGRKSLDVGAFTRIVKKCVGSHGIREDQIGELFRKVDYSASGQIAWDEFCNYMQLEYTRITESYTQSKQVAFLLPASISENFHGEPIIYIYPTSDNSFIVVREDGTISFWSAQLELKLSKKAFEQPCNRKSKWITGFTLMPQYNKFILSTGDREIQIYELSTFAPYCQINGLEIAPLQLDYCCTGEDDCMILYGDDQGCVNILLLSSVAATLRMWKRCPKVDDMSSISLENAALLSNVTYIRWKVHEDWVTQLKYYDSIQAVISTSNHEATAMVIGCTTGTTNLEQEMKELKESWKEGKRKKSHSSAVVPQKRLDCDQSVFQVYKGVKTFDFCKKSKLVVTGGLDRIVRLWNPYIPGKPTGVMRGHCAPIFFVCIDTAEKKIFSISIDNTVKIWDIEDQCCLVTVNAKASGIRGDLATCCYAPGIKALFIATDSIALLRVRLKPKPDSNLLASHKEPVLCCRYNKEFQQVVSCSEGSKVKVWDLDTGSLMFEFSEAHKDSAISCMTFDDSGRRLITGGRDGCLKIWNYNNGQCLRTLKKVGKCAEISDCAYVEIHKRKYVIAVGWDRRINIYYDSFADLNHIQRPHTHWEDDLKHGHKDDILCVAQCPPTLLATSSHDGEIIVWRMISGHICCRLQTPLPVDCKDREAFVDNVVFLKTRVLKTEFAACLVSTGPQGLIFFWNLLNGGQMAASFTATKVQSSITKLAVTEDDSLLYAASHMGFIYVYNIKDYALIGPEVDPPKTINYWRAHISSVTSMQLIDEQKLILTSSADCTVRLWSMDAAFIGTFGQPELWQICAPASWKHPMVPYEILIDPFSMPVHPLMETGMSAAQITNSSKCEENKKATERKTMLYLQYKSSGQSSQLATSDADIKEEIRKRTKQNTLGKRLRHERFRSLNKPLNHGGPTAYHTLKCFEIANTPIVFKKPDLSAASMDPFLTTFLEKDTNSL